jgi:hypothetical protein
MPLQYSTNLTTWHSTHVALLVLHFIFCFVKVSRYGEWQDPHSFMYMCTCSALMSSLPLTSYIREEKLLQLVLWKMVHFALFFKHFHKF